MKDQYVLCVGGSGAKSGEALIHCLAAGVAPAALEMHFLDQDLTNGNLVRTRRLAAMYMELRKSLRPDLERMDNGFLFRAPLNEGGEVNVYPPVHPPFGRLGQLFQRDLLREEARHFFDSLFDRDQEIDLELVHGFRGRPGIGQAVLAAGQDTGLAFWTELNKRIDHRLHHAVDSQRYFLVGSAFGGTGAAGVPTVARHIHGKLNRSPTDRRGLVGAALFLPYFQYPPDDPKREQDTGRLLRSSSMMARARLALDYYRLEMDPSTRWAEGPADRKLGGVVPKRSPHFDSLYVIGWPEMIDLGYVAAGGGVQDNPALLPELLGALAALHFVQDDVHGNNGRVYRAGFVGDAVDWDDLPTPRKSFAPYVAMRPLATLVRFAFAYKYIYHEALFGEENERVRKQVWYQNLIGATDMSTPRVVGIARTLLRYCDQLLRWAASLALHGEDPKCRLFDVSRPCFATFTDERDENGGHLPRRIHLFEEMGARPKFMRGPDDARYLPVSASRSELEPMFQNLVRWSTPLCGLDGVYRGLSTARPKNKADRGFATFLHFLWVACAQSKEDRI